LDSVAELLPANNEAILEIGPIEQNGALNSWNVPASLDVNATLGVRVVPGFAVVRPALLIDGGVVSIT
jgi:hypothetical protein